MTRFPALLLTFAVLSACDQGPSPVAPDSPDVTTAFARGGGGQARVAICHLNDEGDYHRIEVASPAVPAHMAHGDGLPDSGGFDADCSKPAFTLDYSATVYATLVGAPAPSGTDYIDHCAPGSVAVAVEGWMGSYGPFGGSLSATSMICRVLLSDGSLGASDTTTVRGLYGPGSGGPWTSYSAFSGVCQGDQVMVGASGAGNDVLVSSITGACSAPATIVAGSGPDSYFGPFTAPGASSTNSADSACPTGYVATGIYGASGDVSARYGMICNKLG